jgi:hypothetical protein
MFAALIRSVTAILIVLYYSTWLLFTLFASASIVLEGRSDTERYIFLVKPSRGSGESAIVAGHRSERKGECVG